MIDASHRLLSTAAAVLLVVTLTGAGSLPETATQPPVDPLPVASADDPTEVGWDLLATLNYRTGEAGEDLAALALSLIHI